MAYNADNSDNFEIYSPGPESASPEQLSLLYIQATSLYEKAQNSASTILFKDTEVTFNPSAYTATFRHGKYASLGLYNELTLSFTGPLLTIIQTVSVPRETGRDMGVRNMLIDERGNSYRGEQTVWQEDRTGFLRESHSVDVHKEDYDTAPKEYADTAQQLIDSIWSIRVPKRRTIARLLNF